MKYIYVLALSIGMFSTMIVNGQNVAINEWQRLKTTPELFKTLPTSIDAKVAQIYENTTPLPEQMPKEIKQYQRFYFDWHYRLASNASGQLSYKSYFDACKNYASSAICVSEDDADWQLLGPFNYPTQNMGLVDEVLPNRNQTDDIIISSNHGGLWKRHGNAWSNVTDNLRLPGISATEIIRNPYNNSHVIASTGNGLQTVKYGMGLIESFDNGEHWQLMTAFPNEELPYCPDVYIDPNDRNPEDGITMYAITFSKIFKSTNTGQNWIEIEAPNLANTECLKDIKIDDLGNIYVTTSSQYERQQSCLRKYDGSSWTNLSEAANIYDSVRYQMTEPQNGMFFLIGDANAEYRHVYKTEDYGNTFIPIHLSLNIETASSCEIRYSRASNIVYIADIFHVYYFKNDGVYTTHKVALPHMDIRDVEIVNTENGQETILVGTDGGISRITVDTNNLNIIENVNINGESLPITNFYGLGVASVSDTLLECGAVHNHTYRYNSEMWQNHYGGDGGDCAFNFLDPAYYYYQGNSTVRNANTTIYSGSWFIGSRLHINQNNPYELLIGRSKKLVIINEKTGVLETKQIPGAMKAVGPMYVDGNNQIWIADYNHADPLTPFRLAKSSNHGDTWEDMTNGRVYYQGGTQSPGLLKDVCQWSRSIRGIVGNPNNSNELWIGLGGVYTESNEPVDNKLRVFHTTDGGGTWQDISNGLPSLPINQMLFVNNNKEFLFAATDVGVFYKTRDMDSFECFNNGLPTAIVTDLEYNYLTNTLYASTDGRGVFSTRLPLVNNIVISENTTWKGMKYGNSNITVESGSILRIKGYLLMGDDKKIIVEKGAQLIVDGGTITNTGDNFWQGIAVIGTQNQPATPTYQGAVRLINGATIANARCGVQLYLRQDDGEPMMSTSNGILIADNANFINNIIGVDAAFCAKSHAVISRSHFVIDEDYYNKINRQPYMVKLYEASNLIVNNNIFENKYINNTSFDNNKLPVGVKAYNSALRIINGNTFKNLRYGIHAYETTMNSVSEISNNNFDKNITGIYMSDVHTPQIFFNTFTIEPFNADWSDILRLSGIYLDGVIGHSVEENTFNGLIQEKHKTIGLLVNNGGAQDVEVYKNEFTQLNYAILAQNNNRSADGLSGLCVKCNTFTDNQNDVSVSTSNLFTHAKDGIAINQGSPTAPAANLFTAGTYPQLQWNIYNLPGLDKCINYYVPRNELGFHEFMPSNTQNVRIIKIFSEFTINNCSSHHPIVIGGDTSKLLTKERMQTAWQKADSSQTVLAARTDEGNTTALQSDVSTTNIDEAYAMRNRLLNVAPYTSTTVLKEVVEQENTINNALVRDVLVANPQAAKSEAVMTAVESKSQPMSDYMLAEIEAGQNSISAKEQLEAKATLNRTSYTDALHDLIYLHLADTNNVYAQDSMIALLHGSQHLYDTYLLADVYLQMQDAQQTRTCLAQLPNRFVLSEAQQAEYNALMDYYNWRIALINANRSLTAIDSNELNQLQAWYNNAEQALLQTKALNALRIADAISYQEPYVLPDETGTPEPMAPISLEQAGKTNIQSAMDMRLYPNPASAYVVVEYKLSRAAAAFIRITASGTGKTLWQQSVNKAQDAMVIDLEAMAAGHYIVQLYVDNVLTESETLSIAK